MRTDDLCRFIRERHAIYERRAAGLPKPWTTDSILRDYRFCNVYRELDKETQWIAQNWREPNRLDRDLWFAMLVARVVNWSPTLSDLGYPVPWEPQEFQSILTTRQADGHKVWTGAYMITTHKHPMAKIDYYALKVLTPAWNQRNLLRPRAGQPLYAYHDKLMRLFGISSFLAGQVVADLKYAPILTDAKDWWTWAAPGAGSVRGLNRVFGRPYKTKLSKEQFSAELGLLHSQVGLRLPDMPRLHAQDLQNCLCEFDKYERVRLEQGRPRSVYNGRK